MSVERLSHENELPSLSRIPALVLCAGAGTRMQVLTEYRIPKSLIQIDGVKKLLDYPLELIQNSGIKEVVLCVSHLSEKIVNYYGYVYGDLFLQYSQEPIPLGTLNTFRVAIKKIDPKTDFFLLHGDEIISGVSLREMFGFHLSHRRIATALLSANPLADRTVVMRVESDGTVTDSVRGGGEYLSNYVASLGLFIFRPEIKYEVDRFITWEEMVRTLAHEGKLSGFVSEAKFFNINSPSDISKFLGHSSQQS